MNSFPTLTLFRTDQISELQARLEGLQQVHETDGITYNKRLTDMEAEFARTKEQLASENMVRNAYLEIVFRVGKKCIPKCTSGIDKNVLNRVFSPRNHFLTGGISAANQTLLLILF